MKIRPVRARLYHLGWTDGWTDKYDEANRCFSKFCECALKHFSISRTFSSAISFHYLNLVTHTVRLAPCLSIVIKSITLRPVKFPLLKKTEFKLCVLQCYYFCLSVYMLWWFRSNTLQSVRWVITFRINTSTRISR